MLMRINEMFGIFMTIAFGVAQVVTTMTVGCCILVYYLSYYIISSYIRMLKRYSTTDSSYNKSFGGGIKPSHIFKNTMLL